MISFSELQYLEIIFLIFTEASADITAKKSDVTTLRGSFENVMRQHYPTMIGRIAVKLVPCPAIVTSALSILSRFVLILWLETFFFSLQIILKFVIYIL